ncbi:MAG: alkaline phosphatase [Bacteroidales bacterium]|jgi:alkaline phosphatase|nr:alkaline phosphatase [Bacteroidales bacterium]
MKKPNLFVCFLLIPLFFLQTIFAQQEVKNVIVMIPDGTSINLLSLSRWYQHYTNPEAKQLCVDPYLCGVVRTYSSDCPIGDSAPTTSCYMTGQPTQTGFVSMYPRKTMHDLVKIDSLLAYYPLATALEGARIFGKKSTGLVFTCEFPHATPADCAAHWYKRSQYPVIAKQMVHNQINVVFGGGNKFLTDDLRAELKQRNYAIFSDDLEGFRNNENPNVWALFEEESLPYSIDNDPAQIPSLAEMTSKAIQLLSANENGFFLMVEGSKIDWAAHDNDAKTMITDFLAFDEAVGAAIDFAKRDGQTVVIILPDHGNSGIVFGNRRSNKGYDKLPLDSFLKPLTRYTISSYKLAQLIKGTEPENVTNLFQEYHNIHLTNEELTVLYNTTNYDKSPIEKAERTAGIPLEYAINKILYDNRSYIGFTTYGHTGEDVFLAVYHPHGDIPVGMITNVEMNQYICRQLQLEGKFKELNNDYFAPHQEIFGGFKNVKIDSLGKERYVLTVKMGKNMLKVESYTNYAEFNGNRIPLSTVAVYVDKLNTFFIPRELANYFIKK